MSAQLCSKLGCQVSRMIQPSCSGGALKIYYTCCRFRLLTYWQLVSFWQLYYVSGYNIGVSLWTSIGPAEKCFSMTVQDTCLDHWLLLTKTARFITFPWLARCDLFFLCAGQVGLQLLLTPATSNFIFKGTGWAFISWKALTPLHRLAIAKALPPWSSSNGQSKQWSEFITEERA